MQAANNRIITGRSLDRVINFSDAVVAVAITVLVLPVVAIDGPSQNQSMLDVIQANSGQLTAFVVTFFMLFIFWQGHHRVFENFSAINNSIMWLNAGWLATVAFLPWPSKLIDMGNNSADASWLYCLTLCVNALLLHFIYQVGRRHPEFLVDPKLWSFWLSISFVFAVAFAVLFVASLIWPGTALWLLFLLFPLRFIVQQKGIRTKPSRS